MSGKTFDAKRYITKVSGKEYLEVKWRLLWLRTEHPEAVIATELVHHDSGLALFKARVSLPGGAEATGWGSETVDDFADYIEKAETKALGRALAALGYGTQFCEDFDFLPKVVDAPVSNPPATAAQLKAIRLAAQRLKLSESEVNHRCRQSYGHSLQELTRKEASQFISSLRSAA